MSGYLRSWDLQVCIVNPSFQRISLKLLAAKHSTIFKVRCLPNFRRLPILRWRILFGHSLPCRLPVQASKGASPQNIHFSPILFRPSFPRLRFAYSVLFISPSTPPLPCFPMCKILFSKKLCMTTPPMPPRAMRGMVNELTPTTPLQINDTYNVMN